jgi:hypothetical protein
MAVDLMLPFAIAAVASSLRAIGDLTTVQKINDTRWQRPDMRVIRGGLAANGVGTMVSGFIGATAIGTTSGSVGASAATGITSRVVGHATGVLFIVFAFFPTILDLLILIPRPVMGAALMFSSCFINVSAMQVMTSRLMDARRTLVIGIGLLLAFSRFLFPGFYANAPHLLQPALSSPLVIGLLGALLLNLLFRIGVKKSAWIEFTPGVDPLVKLEDFAEHQGGVWGARRDRTGGAGDDRDGRVPAAADCSRQARPYNHDVRRILAPCRDRVRGQPAGHQCGRAEPRGAAGRRQPVDASGGGHDPPPGDAPDRQHEGRRATHKHGVRALDACRGSRCGQ